MFLRHFLQFVLLLAATRALSPQPKMPTSSGTTTETFAFWYDPWQPGVTLKKLQQATVIIGVPPSAVSEIHKSGRRALQYVTYYQSQFKTAFLNDRNDLANVGFQVNGEFEKSAFGGQDNYVLCPNSVEMKARALRYLDSTLKRGFDGYFVDNTFLQPAAQEVCAAHHQHISVSIDGWQSYVNLVIAVKDRLKKSNPKALLMINAGNPASLDRMASAKSSLWDIADYVLWESYGYSSYRGPRHDRWKSTIAQSFAYAAMPEKAPKLLVLSYPENLAEARFSFAVARIFGFNWTANLGDSDQNTGKEGGHFGAYLNDVPFDLGKPLGNLPNKPSPLLRRVFQNGEIFANTGATPQPISIPKGRAAYIGDQEVRATAARQLILEPMTAVIVLKRP